MFYAQDMKYLAGNITYCDIRTERVILMKRVLGGHIVCISLQWRHNQLDGVSNHQPHDCLFNRLFKCKWKKTPKLHVTGLCEGNSPVTDEFPTRRTSNLKKFPFDYVIMVTSLLLNRKQSYGMLEKIHWTKMSMWKQSLPLHICADKCQLAP